MDALQLQENSIRVLDDYKDQFEKIKLKFYEDYSKVDHKASEVKVFEEHKILIDQIKGYLEEAN